MPGPDEFDIGKKKGHRLVEENGAVNGGSPNSEQESRNKGCCSQSDQPLRINNPLNSWQQGIN